MIGDQGFDFVHMPNPVLVPPSEAVRRALMGRPIQRFTGLRMELLSRPFSNGAIEFDI